jgi:hypothetical protein
VKPKKSRKADQYTPQGHDLCQTPAYAVEPLLKYLNPGGIIWEPAMGEGHLVNALLKARFCVERSDLQTGQNFFEYSPHAWDCIVTNPPYTLKFEWLARCYELGKPFALLVPVETIGAGAAQRLMERYGYEIMLLDKRVDFKMPNKGWRSQAQFPVLWLCWKMLRSPVVFGKLNKPRKSVHPEQPSLFIV